MFPLRTLRSTLMITIFLSAQIILSGCNSSGGSDPENINDTRVIEVIEPEEELQFVKSATSRLSGQMQYIDASLYLISVAFQALDGSGVGTSPEGGKLSISRIANGNTVFSLYEFIMGSKTYNSSGDSPLTLIPADGGFQLTGELIIADSDSDNSIVLEIDLDLNDQKIGLGNITCDGEVTAVANYDFMTGRFIAPKDEKIEVAVSPDEDASNEENSKININFDENGQISVDYSNLLRKSMTRPTALFSLTEDSDNLTAAQKRFLDTGGSGFGDDNDEIKAQNLLFWLWLLLQQQQQQEEEPKEPEQPPVQPAQTVDPGYSNTPGTRILLVGDSWTEQVAYKFGRNLLNSSLNTHNLGSYSSWGGSAPASQGGLDATAIAGTDAIISWSNPDLRKNIDRALSLFPAIDIVHLSLGGNDFIYGLKDGKNAFDEGFQNEICDAIAELIEYIHELKPEIKINIVGYTNVRMDNYPLVTKEFFNLAVQSLEMKKEALADKYDYVYYTKNLDMYGNPPPESAIASDGFHLKENGFQILMDRCVEMYYKYWLRGRQAPPNGGSAGTQISNYPPAFGEYQLMWPGGIEKIHYLFNIPIAATVYLDVHLDYSDPDGYITSVWYYGWENGWVEKTNDKVFRFKTIVSWWNLHGSGGFTAAVFDNNYNFTEQRIHFSW